MAIKEDVRKMKLVSPYVAASSIEIRNTALQAVADTLQKNADVIFAENKKDLTAAETAGISSAVVKRLKFNEEKLSDVIKGIAQLISLPDPLEKNTLARELDAGLVLKRVTCPIGVIGVIFEARPDALVQISTLCMKSGNCVVLKGGKETTHTNRILFHLIYEAAVNAGYPEGSMLLAETHSEIDELLDCEGLVDLLIPRGSNAFVQYIMNNTKIPVMGHADGICHIYVDRAADYEKAIRIITDAKTQYTAACNAVETLLVNREIAAEFLPKLANELHAAGIRLRTTAEASAIIEADTSVPLETIDTSEFREYLDLIVSVGIAGGLDEAVNHINKYGSHHTDAIITEDSAAAERFMQLVDSAGVYQNCSTRFADGFRYGFGAEVGISTSKLHARGPVGLEGLVTYKYKLYGQGQIVGDYASGKAEFHFKDL